MISLQQRFLEFCKGKPADENYCAWDEEECALAQFGLVSVHSSNLAERGVPEAVYDAALSSPNTFGELVKRLEALRLEEGGVL
jgi:hypothetical protein